MAAWQCVLTSPGMTSRPRQSISRRPGCAARNCATAPSSEVTSAIRLPATPTDPVNVRAPSPHMGSSVAFKKSVAIGHFLIFVRPPRVFTFTGSSSIELPCTVTTSRPSTEFE